jgi:hypothetical protein
VTSPLRIPDGRSEASGFDKGAGGNPTVMQQSEELPDDVPVADAAEQRRTASEPVPDEEESVEPPDDVPLEAPPPDWQEQLETVDLDPELDRDS